MSGGAEMDKEKLKKYAGFAGLGILVGFINFLLGFILGIESMLESGFYTMGLEPLIYIVYGGPITILVSILGGCIGGAITKKWWGSLVAGFFLSGLVFFLMLSDYIL